MNSNQVTGWDLIHLTLIYQLRAGLFFKFCSNSLSVIRIPMKEVFIWTANTSEIE